MMRIVWSPQAAADLRSVHSWIARENEATARGVVEQIMRRIMILPDHPSMGRPGRVRETRELIVTGTPYLVPYRVRGDRIEIIRVYHARRKWPPDPI